MTRGLCKRTSLPWALLFMRWSTRSNAGLPVVSPKAAIKSALLGSINAPRAEPTATAARCHPLRVTRAPAMLQTRVPVGRDMALTAIFPPFSSPLPRRKRGRTNAPHVQASAPPDNLKLQLRVCVNRSCAKQGSRDFLLSLSALAPPALSVASCGCLGRCGAGPNVAVLPRGDLVGHCGTPARAAELLACLCGPHFDPATNLQALGLRKRAELALEKGNAAEAVALLSQAVELNPSGGLHVLYNTRSAAKLAMGDSAAALLDAKEASKIAPNFPQGYISQGDAFLAMEEYNSAEEAYATALDLDPSIRRSKSFKARITKLQEKLTAANASS